MLLGEWQENVNYEELTFSSVMLLFYLYYGIINFAIFPFLIFVVRHDTIRSSHASVNEYLTLAAYFWKILSTFLQPSFLNSTSWIKIFIFCLNFDWTLFNATIEKLNDAYVRHWAPMS